MGVIRVGPPPGPWPSSGVAAPTVGGDTENTIRHGRHLKGGGGEHMGAGRLHEVTSRDIARVANRGWGIGRKGGSPGHGWADIDDMLPIRMRGATPRTARVPAPTTVRNQGGVHSMRPEHIHKGLVPGTGPLFLELDLLPSEVHTLIDRMGATQPAP